MGPETQQIAGTLRGRYIITPFVGYLLLGFAQRGIWVLMLPIYLVMLAPDQFGVLILVIFMARILAVASILKLDAAMRTFYFDFVDEEEGPRLYMRRVLTASIVLACVYYLVMLVLGDTIFEFVFKHDDLQFYPGGAIALATACIDACLAPYFIYLRNGLLLREFIWLQIALIVSNVLLQMYFIIVLDFGIYGALLGALVPSAIALIYVIAVRSGFEISALNETGLAPSLRYSAPLIIFSLFYMAGSRLDVIMLEKYIDMNQLGAYAMLISVLGVLIFALNALDNAIRPFFYPALRRDDDNARDEVRRFRELYFIAGLSVLSLAILLGSGLSLVTDNPSYLAIRQWLPFGATAFLPLIVMRYYSMFYDFHKRSGEVTYWSIIRTLLMFVLLLLLVPSFGIGGALFAVFVSQLANAVVLAVSARRKFSLDIAMRWTLRQVALFLTIIWLLYYFIGRESMSLYGGLQFVAFMALLATTNWHEIRAIGGTYRRHEGQNESF